MSRFRRSADKRDHIERLGQKKHKLEEIFLNYERTESLVYTWSDPKKQTRVALKSINRLEAFRLTTISSGKFLVVDMRTQSFVDGMGARAHNGHLGKSGGRYDGLESPKDPVE